MNQTQRKRIYYPSLNLFVSCTSRCCENDVISEVHKIHDVLHFLEIREMSGIFQSWPIFIEYKTFCLSEVHLLNKVLAD